MKTILHLTALLALSASLLLAETAATEKDALPPLTIRGEDYVDPSGKVVRFWGANLVSLYPDHAAADALAANLAHMQVNLARPHHLLRQSLDWSPRITGGALVTYKETSREIDPNALERFDYLNAALRRHGIYLAFSAHFTRKFLPGDVDIIKTDDADRKAWMAAMAELNGWDWKKNRDVYKMLPSVDERAALLSEEFIRNLLTHVNPYTGKSYATDPQVLTMEIKNEASTEYAIVCGNRFPDYWQKRLEEKWKTYATAAGIEPGDIYKPADAKAKDIRAKFLRQLDEDYFNRLKAVIRGTGYANAMTYSNLWLGENALEMQSRTSDQIEDHIYMDPLVTRTMQDGFYNLTRSALAGKPFFVGELNQAEGTENIKRQSPVRSMLPLASSAYGSLQNWSGLVWFAWLHGDISLAVDGWSANEARASDLGQMINDGQMLDHMRTAGIIFRRGLVAKSVEPVTIWVDEPFTAGDYSGLMRGKYSYRPGWDNVHEMRKAFGPVPESQPSAPWMKQSPTSPVVSDTKEITKDLTRRQLTVSAPQTEGFSGYLDKEPPTNLRTLGLEGEGFATVILVADDNKPLAESSSLIISRTALDARDAETVGPRITLRGLKTPAEGAKWQLRLTRPRASATLMKDFTGVDTRPAEITADGALVLPTGAWHELEIVLSSAAN